MQFSQRGRDKEGDTQQYESVLVPFKWFILSDSNMTNDRKRINKWWMTIFCKFFLGLALRISFPFNPKNRNKTEGHIFSVSHRHCRLRRSVLTGTQQSEGILWILNNTTLFHIWRLPLIDEVATKRVQINSSPYVVRRKEKYGTFACTWSKIFVLGTTAHCAP